MLKAYCDESYDGQINTTPVYVVAGFIADTANWQVFETRWKSSMRDLGIQKIGFHASQVENGLGAYEGMSEQARRQIQERLVADILASNLLPVVHTIDVDGFRLQRHKFEQFLGDDNWKYSQPHILAVNQWVSQVCRVTNDTNQIEVVLDRNHEFKIRVEAWFENAKSQFLDHPCYKRLGQFVHVERLSAVGLQAADLLAHAAFRNASGRPSRVWVALNSARTINQSTTGAKFWRTLADMAGSKMEGRSSK